MGRGPLGAEYAVDHGVEPLPFVAPPGVAQSSLVCETSVRQHPLHRSVVVTGVGLDSVQLGIAGEEVVHGPSSSPHAEAASSMPTGDSEIEQRCPFADVAEIEEPNKSDRLAVINDPEARDVRVLSAMVVEDARLV